MIQGRRLVRGALPFLLASAALGCGSSESDPTSPPPDLAITGATLIDGTGAPPRPETTILVRDGRISAVVSDSDADVPDAAAVIDAAGKYVIPGLADMHQHFGRGELLPNDSNMLERELREYLFYGVTTVLNFGSHHGRADEIVELRRRQAEGEILAPHIYATGGLVTVPGSHPIPKFTRWLPEGVDPSTYDWSRFAVWVVRTPVEVREVVTRMATAGMDGIKVVVSAKEPKMPLEMVRAAVEEARTHGLPVFTHATSLDALNVSLEAGVHAVVHLVTDPEPPGPEVLAEMRQSDIYLVPTLSVMVNPDVWGDPSENLTDPFLWRGVDPRLIESYLASPRNPTTSPSAEEWRGRRETLRALKAAHDAGVKLTGGTDHLFSGYSMHHELELMVEAGLTPMEALVIATRRAAEMLGEEDVFGTLEPGKRADLLVLGADPLEDIRNTRTLEVVIRGGEVIDRSSLLPEEYTSALARSTTVAIRDVTVVDVTDGSLRTGQTVLVEGDRIGAVGAAAEVDVPATAEILEGAGAYLIPGLWDMHVHATFEGRVETFFPLFLANGVTGIRDTWGSLEVADSARAAVERGELAGPVRVVVAGNLVDGPARILPGSQVALTPEDGRRIVDSLHAAGAPFVKVYWSLTRETYLAIAERSRELGMPFAGHVPLVVRAAEASDAGQRSVEHLHGVLVGCAEEEGAILAGYRRAQRAHLAGELTRSPREVITEGRRRALATQDDARCRDLAARFIRNETWQVPTLVTLRGHAYLRQLAAAGDERLRYLPPSIYEDDWFPESNGTARGPWEDWRSMRQARYERKKEIVRLMTAAGVPFLAGSDTANPWAFPGFGLHDELELLVEAGLTPLQALRAATLNPARFFDRTDELGTVEEGKLADLVLLDANPLEDITNTRRIRAVVADGRLYRRADLDRLLAEVEASVQQAEKRE